MYAESLRAYTSVVISYGVMLGAADGSGFVGEYTEEIQRYARKAREAATAMARLEMGTPSIVRLSLATLIGYT